MFWKKRNLVLIAGCGRLGASLAGSLSETGESVVVIDKDKTSFRRLPANFSGFQQVGDATSADILEAAGIAEAAVVVAATKDDNCNCMIAQIASRIYNVGEVYTRLHDPSLEKILAGYHIQAIYPVRLSIQEFQRLSGVHLPEESL